MSYIHRFRAALAALALLCIAFGAQAQVWFGDERGLHRFDPNSGLVDVDLAFGEALSLVTDRGDGSVWILSKTRLARFSSDGSMVVFNRTLASFPGNLGTARKMAVNTADATAWVAGERRILHVNGGGGELLSVVPGEATDLAVAQDGTLWVLDEENDELRRYTSGGLLLQRVNLGGASRRAHHLALDSLRGNAWLVADRAIVKRSIKSPGQVLASIDVAHDADAICSDLETGDLWVLGNNVLYGYRPDGTRFATRDLRGDGIANAKSLACDHASRSLWVGHRRGFSRFTRDGDRMLTQRARDSDWVAVAREARSVRPELFGPDWDSGTTFTDRQPSLTFVAGANCGPEDCGFDPTALVAYTYDAKLDGLAVGNVFVLDTTSGEVFFQPAAPLADGPHTLTVQAVDGSGNRSELLTFTFNVDATPPALVTVTPPNGTRFPLGTSLISIDATFDASAVSVWMNGNTPQAGNRLRTAVFGGSNATVAFTLHAVDQWGNHAEVPMVYTVEQPNRTPIVRLVQPSTGQVFDAPANIAVEATATDSDGTVDRVRFVLGDFVEVITVTSPPYRAVFTGVPIGQYTVTAVAFDDRGAANGASATVTVQGPPTVTITSPAPGAELFEGNQINVAFKPAPNRTIQSLTILRDGQFSFTVFNPVTPYSLYLSGSGVHTYRFVATDSTGAQGTAEITLTLKPFELVVDTPAANAEVTVGTVHVNGRYSGPADTVIRVNGTPAVVTPTSPDGGTFAIGFVPLAMGPRVIEVDLSSPSLAMGRVYRVPITVVGVVIVPPPYPPIPPVGGGIGGG